MTTTLAHARVTATGATPPRWMLFLHGILGSGANWRGFARRLVAERPAWGALLVDLRMHGASQGLPPPHTLAACAGDVRATLAAEGLAVDAVVGHSFGGKVALELAAGGAPGLRSAWVLDAMPGPRVGGDGSETTLQVLAWLRARRGVIASREGFIAEVSAQGFGADMGPWLAMNLRRDGDGYAFRLDLDAIDALLADYFRRDLWPVLERPPAGLEVDVVVGGRSGVFDPAARARLAAIAAAPGARVRAHLLPDAGHWVHVDAPDPLHALIAAALPD